MTLEEYNKAVDQYADNLYRFILKNCRNIELAQDIVQDSFEKMWMKMDQVDGEKARSYLFSARKKTLCFSNLYNFFPVNPVFQVHL
jgi:DNA-directed RNA polymerase specialized sigma24 family protein